MAGRTARTDASPRALRGADGLRGVRSRHAARARGTRPSSGRGPSARGRWERGAPAPVAVDRAESLALDGLAGPLPARLLGPLARRPLPVVVAFGSGGTRAADLTADERWARELADQTGALVVLCGYRRAEAHEGQNDAAAAWADLSARAAALGGTAERLAVAGRGAGFRLAARLAADAATWPALPSPAACVAVTPVAASASALRDALRLPAAPRPAHPLRPGTEVLTADGQRLGRIAEVRGGDVLVRRTVGADDLYVPLRAVHRVHGAVTLRVRAGELALRDWGRSATDLASPRRDSRN